MLYQKHAVIMELYDPQGKLYSKKVSADGVSGMYALILKQRIIHLQENGEQRQ